MNIAVLGTGNVGKALSGALAAAGHVVTMGSRTADNEAALAWTADNGVLLATFADAVRAKRARHQCNWRRVSIEVLKSVGEDALAGKVLIDVANPLDFSKGFPPTLSVCNDDSLGEQIQREFPSALVVKALNTLNCDLMVNPSKVPGDHVLFIAGNDADAKAKTVALLWEFGWPAERSPRPRRHLRGACHRDVLATVAAAHAVARSRELQHQRTDRQRALTCVESTRRAHLQRVGIVG